jgi:hypothetical protein
MATAAIWSCDQFHSKIYEDVLLDEGWAVIRCDSFENLQYVCNRNEVHLVITHWHDEKRNHGRVRDFVRSLRTTERERNARIGILGTMHPTDHESLQERRPNEWWPADWAEYLALYDGALSQDMHPKDFLLACEPFRKGAKAE